MPDFDHPDAARVSAGTAEHCASRLTGSPPPVLMRSAQLLGTQRAVVIEHEGSHYVLRATRNGKLILTK
ncbi:MAG: hemin uptake protein HemP [Thauera sp.]|jgi:hemin uptake protein HemP